MAIAVTCHCGKKFKAKDRLAGKAIRCPACKGRLVIPGGAGGGAACAEAGGEGSGGVETSKADEEKAILRVEKARKNKQLSAEEEAAYREEQNKLIASYDQLAGKNVKAKKKKGEPAPGKPRKHTFFAKVADGIGTVCSTLAFKYCLVVALVSGGVVGSIILVQAMAGYVQEEGGPLPPEKQRVRELFEEAETAIEEKKWGEARDCLNKLLQIRPNLAVNRDYRELKRRLEEGFEGG